MRARSLIVAMLLVASQAASGAQRITVPQRSTADARDERLARLELWMKAAARHSPGEADDSRELVGGWSEDQLRALWMDASALIALMHRSSLLRFTVKGEVMADAAHVKYNDQQLKRLRALACAATGKATWASLFFDIVADPVCLSAPFMLDAELRQLSLRAAAAKRDGDQNYFVRRAAMLHGDIAVAPPGRATTAILPSYQVNGTGGPDQIRLDLSDGHNTGLHEVPIHWIIGRTMLDDVRPPGATRPAPGGDEMVREWYRASAAWMQHTGDYDTLHVAHALRLFPNDPDILFLAGCLHETFASPNVQRAAQAATVPSGFSLDVTGYRLEFEQAETLFRRALEHRRDAPEIRLRLGHVLLRLGKYDEAARELRQVLPRLDADQELLYDGELFLGAAEGQLRHDETSRAAFERAAALYPAAQSPWLSLSELARRRGDRAQALRYMERVFALPAKESERIDPWWKYHFTQVRNVEHLFDELRRPFRVGMTP
jgi:hypothetical protein